MVGGGGALVVGVDCGGEGGGGDRHLFEGDDAEVGGGGEGPTIGLGDCAGLGEGGLGTGFGFLLGTNGLGEPLTSQLSFLQSTGRAS